MTKFHLTLVGKTHKQHHFIYKVTNSQIRFPERTYLTLKRSFTTGVYHQEKMSPSDSVISESIKAIHYADSNAPICRLEVKKHFDSLTDKEKKYAHYISRASWEGTRILAAQLSEESPKIFDMLLKVFADPKDPAKMRDIDDFKKSCNIHEEEFKYFMEYTAQALTNVGNYRSFGDTKFIPRLSESAFETIVKASGNKDALVLFHQVQRAIFDFSPEAQLLLGFPAEGHVSGYYSKNMSKEDVEYVQSFIESKGISALNTRLFKDGSTGDFTLVIASAEKTKEPMEFVTPEKEKIIVKYGDFAPQMSKIAENMAKAVPFAANDNQKAMLEAYVKSFQSGSIDEHKESQKAWIKDVGPVVETNIGFIETYRDPAGVRAEWEGFVAVVNKEMTLKFENMVNRAEEFVKRLPWPKDFEKDVFNRPDFTSLEVMTFACTGTPPLGINIPNYDDIRQDFGFKNVSLGNVLNAKAAGEKITFIRPEDLELFEKYRGEAFEVQVGLHELLGHGSGKLLAEEVPGKYNFNHSSPPISPITNKPITTWYKPGETWGSVFKAIAASYEECRAECVAMYLGVDSEILSIFGHEGKEAEDITFISYLSMARAGLTSLEFYDPKAKKWGQAHMQARFAILQVFLKSGLVKLDKSENDILIHLDSSKIPTTGVSAIGEFLTKLNVYKATADVKEGTKFYIDSTTVTDEWISVRDLVISKKQPRKMFVQGNSYIQDNQVVFVDYEPTLSGVIQSYIERQI